MDTANAEYAGIQSVQDLKSILGARGPCVSVFVPLKDGPQAQWDKVNSLAWREAVNRLRGQGAKWGEAAQELIASLQDWEAVKPTSEREARSLALFRSPEVFRIIPLQDTVPVRTEIGEHFHIRPLLAEATEDSVFYLLALSQKDVRLLRCTRTSAEEVPLGASVATSFEKYMAAAQTDHNRVNRASAGASAGSSKGIVGTTTSEREAKDEYLLHFFKQLDAGITERLQGHSEPLVLAGVEYEVSLYRRVNSYLNLTEQFVQGAPNSLKAGEMHARGIDALKERYASKLDGALAEYDHKVGAGATNRLKDIVTAAHDGRVLTLIVSDTLESAGSFDESTNRASGRTTGSAGDGDLVNRAAVETILHAGQVLVAPTSKMPHGAPAAAIYRY